MLSIRPRGKRSSRNFRLRLLRKSILRRDSPPKRLLRTANCPARRKPSSLTKIAANIEAIAEPLVERAHLETALAKPRLQAETARTCNQLRLFAKVVEEGSWVQARIDRPDPNRKPLPKPGIRSLLRPLGPVVVFSASNFPLAFSVAGGDTASAFAAGNPVIVKAHSAHPGTSQLVGEAVRNSVRASRLAGGRFFSHFRRGHFGGRGAGSASSDQGRRIHGLDRSPDDR